MTDETAYLSIALLDPAFAQLAPPTVLIEGQKSSN